MKTKNLITILLPLFIVGCINDLFDKGDTERAYDGPTVVGFFPTEQEVSLEEGQATVDVQLIGEQRSSDLSVSFNTDGDAEAGVHYNITTPSPVSISAGTSSVAIVIELIEDSVPEGEEVQLILNLEGGDGVDATANYAQSVLFIQG